jgi:hypothetical protein
LFSVRENATPVAVRLVSKTGLRSPPRHRVRVNGVSVLSDYRALARENLAKQ